MNKKTHFHQIFIGKIIALNALSACHSATHQMGQVNVESAPINRELAEIPMRKNVSNDVVREFFELLPNKEIDNTRLVSGRFDYVAEKFGPSLHKKCIEGSFPKIDFDYLEGLSTYEQATKELEDHLKEIADNNIDKVCFKRESTAPSKWYFREGWNMVRNMSLSRIKVVAKESADAPYFDIEFYNTLSSTLRSLEIDGGSPFWILNSVNVKNFPALEQLYLNTHDVPHGNYIKGISRFTTLTQLAFKIPFPRRVASLAPLEALKKLQYLSVGLMGLRDAVDLIELSNHLASLKTLNLEITKAGSTVKELDSLRSLKIKNKNLKTLRLIHDFDKSDQAKRALEEFKAAHKDEDIAIDLIPKDEKEMWEKYFTI